MVALLSYAYMINYLGNVKECLIPNVWYTSGVEFGQVFTEANPTLDFFHYTNFAGNLGWRV